MSASSFANGNATELVEPFIFDEEVEAKLLLRGLKHVNIRTIFVRCRRRIE